MFEVCYLNVEFSVCSVYCLDSLLFVVCSYRGSVRPLKKYSVRLDLFSTKLMESVDSFFGDKTSVLFCCCFATHRTVPLLIQLEQQKNTLHCFSTEKKFILLVSGKKIIASEKSSTLPPQNRVMQVIDGSCC